VRSNLRNAGCLIMSMAVAGVAAAANDLRLIDAVKAGSAQQMESLLKEGVDVNATQGDGATALHWAVQRDDLATVDRLLKAGAKANVANDNGVTPVFLACTNRSGAIVEKLLAAGANPNAKLIRGETVLMECARTGNLRGVKALLAKGAKVNEKESMHDQTALMWAVSQSHPDVTNALIEFGADINARSRAYQQTVTSEETQRDKREELNYIKTRGGSTALMFAARVGDVESARLLLAAGANPNDISPDGTSILVEAAHSGQGAIGKLLLDKGADPNNAEAGYTALHAAVLRGDLDLVKALLAHGANPNALVTKGDPIRRDAQDFVLTGKEIGATPYFLAARYLEVEMMPILVAAGADPKKGLPDGTTPLMVAAGVGDSRNDSDDGKNMSRRYVYVYDGAVLEPESRVLACVKEAVALGGDVKATDAAGNTALHGAAPLGFDTVVQFLVDSGADVNAKNRRGVTPLGALTGSGRRGYRDTDAVTGHTEFPTTRALLRKLGAVE